MLILLLHYSRTDNEIIIYIRSDANKQSKYHRVYNINLVIKTSGDDVCNGLISLYMRTLVVIQILGFTASEKVNLPGISDI